MSDKEIVGSTDSQEVNVIDGLHLLSSNKLKLAAEGNLGEGGSFAGVGWSDKKALIVEYDKRGGLMARPEETVDEDGNPKKILAKIKNGAFWDFKKRAPRATPLIELQVPPKAQRRVTMEEVGKTENLPLEHESVRPVVSKKSKKQTEEL